MSEIDAYFLSLSRFIREQWAAPEWQKVFFVESSDIKYETSDDIPGRYMTMPQTALRPIDDYRERFEFLLGKGYSWINLNATGIFDGNLLVVIELPNCETGIPRNKVSVNLSGPSLKDGVLQWDIGARLKITA